MLLQTRFNVRDYDLGATLQSGQAFRWESTAAGWEGVVGERWVRLSGVPEGIRAEVMGQQTDWRWLQDYLQVHVDLDAVIGTFPVDEPMQTAVRACKGLRLLRQDPWECLASFVLSSTKQIVQIRQVILQLAERYGRPLPVPTGGRPAFAFPSAGTLARINEPELRDCKMGFRAPYLSEVAKRVASGRLDLGRLGQIGCSAARRELMNLPGVGPKIADCVLLFAYGYQEAFPVDVWIMKALQQLYFPRRRKPLPIIKLQEFAEKHFGPHSGYAQQYLFHYMRTRNPGKDGTHSTDE